MTNSTKISRKFRVFWHFPPLCQITRKLEMSRNGQKSTILDPKSTFLDPSKEGFTHLCTLYMHGFDTVCHPRVRNVHPRVSHVSPTGQPCVTNGSAMCHPRVSHVSPTGQKVSVLQKSPKPMLKTALTLRFCGPKVVTRFTGPMSRCHGIRCHDVTVSRCHGVTMSRCHGFVTFLLVL